MRRFADMEIFVEIQENVRGADVFVIQSTSFPANSNTPVAPDSSYCSGTGAPDRPRPVERLSHEVSRLAGRASRLNHRGMLVERLAGDRSRLDRRGTLVERLAVGGASTTGARWLSS